MTDQRLTNSRMQTAKNCLRKHKLAYEDGIRPESDAATLRFGSLFHEGLDAMKQKQSIGEAIQHVREQHAIACENFLDRERVDLEREKLDNMLNMYRWRWEDMDSKIEVVANEFEFNIPMINPKTGKPSRTWTVAGKIDGIIRLADGRLALIEHKTTSFDLSPDSMYWKRLRMNSQLSIYCRAAHAAGYPVETVIYDVIRKPTIKPKNIPLLDKFGLKIVYDHNGDRPMKSDGHFYQAGNAAKGLVLQTRPETAEEFGKRLATDMESRPEFYFARKEIPRLESELEESDYDVWTTGQIIRDCQNNQRWPRNTDACSMYSTCKYFELCAGGYDPDVDPIPEGFVRTECIHAELSNLEQEKEHD